MNYPKIKLQWQVKKKSLFISKTHKCFVYDFKEKILFYSINFLAKKCKNLLLPFAPLSQSQSCSGKKKQQEEVWGHKLSCKKNE